MSCCSTIMEDEKDGVYLLSGREDPLESLLFSKGSNGFVLACDTLLVAEEGTGQWESMGKTSIDSVDSGRNG